MNWRKNVKKIVGIELWRKSVKKDLGSELWFLLHQFESLSGT
jgi:hypothetical protein